MAKKTKKKPNSSIFKNTFSQIGNLAFYNGWNPNYVYFKSLLKANTLYTTLNGYTTWNPSLAGPIAAQAIADAQTHDHLTGMPQDESNQHFLEKFQQIIQFLKNAEEWEREHEKQYVNAKLKELNTIIKDVKSRQILMSLTKLKKILEDGTIQFNYDNFITLINVIMTDLQTAKITAKYESERIQKIQDILDGLIKSRENQVKGLYKSKLLDNTSEQLEAMSKATDRLQRKITVEYAEHARLTRQENNKYILFGGAQFKNKVKPALAQALAHWANEVIAEVTKYPFIIEQLAQQIEENYNTGGNFYSLSQPIRETIILAILQYGMDNLNSVLNTELNESIQKALIDTLRLNDNKVFDTVAQYNIHGLNNSFGLKGQQLELFHDVTVDTVDQMNKSAKEITNAVQKFINTTEEKMNDDQKVLLTALKENKSENRVRELITLINQIDQLQDEQDKLLKQWKDQTKKIDLTKQTTLSENSTIPITIKVHNGKVTVDVEAVKQALQNNSTFASLNFKEFNPQSLATALSTVKARTSQQLKEILQSSVKQAVDSNLNGLSKEDIVGTMRQALEQLEIKIKGPSLAELMAGIHFRAHGQQLFIDWTGGINGKNDTVTIEIKHNKLVQDIQTKFANKMSKYMEQSISNQVTKIEQLQAQLMGEYQQVINEHVRQLTRSNDMEKYSKMIKDTRINFEELISQDQQLNQTYKSLKKATGKLQNSLEHIGVDEEQTEQIVKQYLNVLENSFYISTTVKSYDTYVNSLGFTGGSLGNSLDTQLARIADIFNSAGMPIDPDDYQWLRSAIINCFPGSIAGEKNKTLIENYLGALMAFALFDEGGAESEIISNFYNTYFQTLKANTTNADILHLYIVDGIYVPGSFVIQKTRETIENEIIPNIQKIPQTMRTGAGITIINKASENDIPNRPIADHMTNADPWAWTITGMNVSEKVSIKILFLAGLLDIVNTINSKLSSVEIPK